MPQIINRKQALEASLRYYFTGLPCKYGHVAERTCHGRGCRECRRLRDVNRYAANADRMNAYHKTRRDNFPDEVRSRDRKAYRADRDNRLMKASRARASNPVSVKIAQKKWRDANRDKRAAHQRNRDAKARATGTHTAADIAKIKMWQRDRCGYCRRKLCKKFHVDHIVALANGGTNDRRNLQVLCAGCNQSKRVYDPITYAQKIGMLI